MLRGLLADPAPAGRVRYSTIPLQYGRGSGCTAAEYPAADLDQHVGPRRLSEFGNHAMPDTAAARRLRCTLVDSRCSGKFVEPATATI